MKISTYANRTAVTFNIQAIGNTHVEQSNAVTMLCRKHNAQQMLFSNKPCFKFADNGAVTELLGNSGGTVTFHSHSCNHAEASQELINLLLSFGLSAPKYFKEITVTHRADGTAYKCPQLRIVEA